MPNSGVKYSTEYLTTEKLTAALLALPETIATLVGHHSVVVQYGWSSYIHPDLTYTPMNCFGKRSLQELIQYSIDRGITVPGESDFLFEVPEQRLEIVICHESDIHLDGNENELLERFMALEPFTQYRWYSKDELE